MKAFLYAQPQAAAISAPDVPERADIPCQSLDLNQVRLCAMASSYSM